MIIIKPITLTDAMITSHSIAETEVAWSALPTYAAADVVKYGNHKKYSSKQGSNLNNIPTAYPDEGAWWLDEGSTNRWNMFDLVTNIESSGTSPVSFTLTPGTPVSALHFDGIVSDTIDISVSDGVSEVYARTVDTRTRDILSWADFYYEPYRYKKYVILHDLPRGVANPVITITLTSSTGTCSLEGFIFGIHYVLGDSMAEGANYTRLSYSQFDKDNFGTVRLTPRGGASKANVRVSLDPRSVDRVMNLLEEFDAQVLSWSAVSSMDLQFFRPFAIRGVYRSPFSLDVAKYVRADLTLEIEGI